MQDNAYSAIITSFKHKALINKDMAIVFADKMHVALHNGQIAMQNKILFTVPNLHPGLKLKAVIIRVIAIATDKV